jgi:hypothetical protein
MGRTAYSVLVGNPEEKSPLKKPRNIRDDNSKMDIRVGWFGMD